MSRVTRRVLWAASLVLAALAFCALGWVLNLAPYAGVARTCFAYHYMPALVYGELILALVIQQLAGPRYFPLAAKLAILAVGLVWAYFTPWIYGCARARTPECAPPLRSRRPPRLTAPPPLPPPLPLSPPPPPQLPPHERRPRAEKVEPALELKERRPPPTRLRHYTIYSSNPFFDFRAPPAAARKG
jgi:hypothetical protein